MTTNRLHAARVANDITTPGTHWTDRHNAAVRNPKGFERGIVRGFQALETIAESYRGSDQHGNGDPIGTDAVGGQAFTSLCRELILLLNFDLGRLDGSTIDKAIRQLAADNGIDSEEI